jgi:hypothetical protein
MNLTFDASSVRASGLRRIASRIVAALIIDMRRDASNASLKAAANEMGLGMGLIN